MESFSNQELAYACRNNDGWENGIEDKKGDRKYYCYEDDSFYYKPSDGGFCPANFKQICITPQGQKDLKAARNERNKQNNAMFKEEKGERGLNEDNGGV